MNGNFCSLAMETFLTFSLATIYELFQLCYRVEDC